MKKFTKLFLLSLCSGFLFLGLVNAQNLEENDPLTGEYDVSSTDNGGFTAGGRGGYNVQPMTSKRCPCDINILEFFSRMFLILIGIILGVLLVVLTIKVVILFKKFNDIKKDIYLPDIPVLNLYSISKITIGKSRFFCIILLLGFFGYSMYKNIYRDRSCCPDPSRQDYAGIIIGILTIIILSVLISKLNTYSKEHSNKELTNK